MSRRRTILIIIAVLVLIGLIAFFVARNKKTPSDQEGFPTFPNVENTLPGGDDSGDPFGSGGQTGTGTGGQGTSTAVLDLSTDAARRYETLFRSEFARPANYNGHYRLVEVPCGNSCTEFYTLDKETGEVAEISSPDTETGGEAGGTIGGTFDGSGNGTVGEGTGDGNTGGGNGDLYTNDDYSWDTFSGSSWGDTVEGFNILTDLGILIAREKLYQEKMHKQLDLVNGIITETYELDQCIPGPRPDWERDADIRFQELANAIPADWHDWDGMSGALKRLVDYTNNKQAVQMFQGIAGLFTGDDKDDPFNRRMYKSLLMTFIGVDVKKTDRITEKTQIVASLQTIYDRYKDPIKKIYTYENPDYSTLPFLGVNKEIVSRMAALSQQNKLHYGRLGNYYDAKEEGQELLNESEILVYTLTSLQNRITKGMPSGIPKRSEPNFSAKIKEYESKLNASQRATLESIDRSFTRIAPDLHTEGDIVEVSDNIENLEGQLSDIRIIVTDCLDATGPAYPMPKERMFTPSYSMAAYIGNPNNLSLGMTFLDGWRFVDAQINDVNGQILFRGIPTSDLFTMTSLESPTIWMLEQLLAVY